MFFINKIIYAGYNNTEKVKLSSLLESEGLESQIAQQKDALVENAADEETADSDTSGYSTHQKFSVKINENMDCDTEDQKFRYNSKNPRHGYSNLATSNTRSAVPPPPPLPPQLMAK